MNKHYYLIAIILLISSITASGQQDSTGFSNLSLEDLMNIEVVTASKEAENIKEAGAIITVFTEKEIQNFGANTLLEIIDKLTSVYTLGNFSIPSNIISIRGNNTPTNNTNVLILLDGRPMRESYANGINAAIYTSFPINRIARIELIRGPGSVLYGTCALTGVINIITKNAEQQGLASAQLKYGAFDTKQVNVSFGKKIGEVDITGGWNFLDSKGWPFTARGEVDYHKDASNKIILHSPKTIDKYQQLNGGNIKLAYKGLTLNTSYNYMEEGMMSINARWRNSADTNLKTSLNHQSQLQRVFVDFGYNSEINDYWNISINTTINNQLNRYYRPDVPNNRTEVGSNDALFELTNYIKPSEKLNIIIGALLNSQSGWSKTREIIENGTSKGIPLTSAQINDLTYPVTDNPFYVVPNYTQAWWSAYIQMDYHITNFMKIIAGAQANQVTDLDLSIVPRVGMVFNFAESWAVKLLYGQSYRSPNGLERSIFQQDVLIGSKSLKPEILSMYEAQVNFTRSNYELAFTYFNSTQTDVITRSAASENLAVWEGVSYPNTPTFINRGKLFSQGFEFEARLNLMNSLSILGSGTYQTTDDDSKGLDLAGKSIYRDGGDAKNRLGMPTTMAKIGINYDASFGLSIGIFNSYFGKGGDIARTFTLDLNPEVKPYNYLSANIRYNLNSLITTAGMPEMTIQISATNLLDAKIYYPEYGRRNMNSIPGRAGRAIYGGISVKF